MIKLLPIGGADDIGASCFYLNIFGTGILLDCGIHPRKIDIEAIPDFSLLENQPLDFVIISHAHQDHIGGLPFLVKKYPHVIIFTTYQTREIAEITLHNAANILRDSPPADEKFEVYTHEEIDLLVRSFNCYKYEEEFFVEGLRHYSNARLKISFHDAGHILGSAGILIEHDGYKIFYTGDINLSHQNIMNGAHLPNTHLDTLILESTYAATDSSLLGSWEDELKRFAASANRVFENGGSILTPVFALGKTQEIIAGVYKLMKKGRMLETDIYTGGIGRQISRIYDRNKYLVNRNDPDLELRDIWQNDLYKVENLSIFRKRPSIILASSGMMIEGTASFRLAKWWLKQKNWAIFIVGYVDVLSPGYNIVEAKQGDKIKLTDTSEPEEINCLVERFYFPSHSRREDLLKIVKKTKPQNVVLIHGEPPAKNWLGYNILHNFKNTKVYSSESGNWITLKS